MFKCKECSYVGEYVSAFCPYCRRPIVLSPDEIHRKKQELEAALNAKDQDAVLEITHILADAGDREAQRDHAIALERGETVTRDLDGAMKYFFAAAQRNDPVSAYRYSRLAERHSEKAAGFWLRYSAVLGCTEAYPRLAERLEREGDERSATYFYSLAALADDVDSIVTMAKRSYEGIGTDRSEPHAKWYLDKLSIPPIHALRLAYRLRSVRAEEPESPRLDDYDRFLRMLAGEGKEMGYHTTTHRLCELLSERGDMEARMQLGVMYAEGIGCTADASQAIFLLESATAHGNANAAKRLGDIYLVGRIVERDAERALLHYRRAAALGVTNAYETMGDVYCEGSLVEKNIAEAIRLWELAAKEGCESARRKADELIRKREALYERAVAIAETAPEEAFACFAASAGMGYTPSYLGLGNCYLEGKGITPDRARAYVWYKKAVEAGERDAFYPLGLCFARGIGIEFNFDAAVKLLTAAARLGSTDAAAELKTLYERKMKHLVQSVYAKGMELIYLKKFAEAEKVLLGCLKAKHAKGIYTLGCLNEFGLGAPTNRERAFKLYECAFDLGFRDPQARYKLRILKMARGRM